MSRRNKLQKFAQLLAFPNVYENFDTQQPELLGENGVPTILKGEWASKHFKNTQPITLELACGRGEYTIGLAERYPNRNFIGVDIKGARIWKGAKQALNQNLTNVAFLRTRIELIRHFFTPNEIDEIWITFPDPFLRNSKSNRRLTSPYFLNLYQDILKPQGLIHLKTDSPELYEFTLQTVRELETHQLLYHNDNIYAQDLLLEVLDIKTYYEISHLAGGRKIKYVQIQQNGSA